MPSRILIIGLGTVLAILCADAAIAPLTADNDSENLTRGDPPDEASHPWPEWSESPLADTRAGCPTELAEIGHAGSVMLTAAVDGDIAFVPEANLIHIVDISQSADGGASDHPREFPKLATIRLADRPFVFDMLDPREVPWKINASAGRLYVAGYATVQVYDVTDPTAPRLLVYEIIRPRTYLDADDGRAHWVRDGRFEIVEPDGDGSLRVTGSLEDPTLLGNWVRVADDRAYVPARVGPVRAETAGVRVIDIADPTRPRAVAFLELPRKADAENAAAHLAVDGARAFVVWEAVSSIDHWTGVHVFDRSGTEFVGVGSVELPGDVWVDRIAVEGDFGVIAARTTEAIQPRAYFALDLTDPSAPQASRIVGPQIGRLSLLALDQGRAWLGTMRGLRVHALDPSGFGPLLAMVEHTGRASGDVTRLSASAMAGDPAVGDQVAVGTDLGVRLLHVSPTGALRDQGGVALDQSADHLIDDGRRLHVAGESPFVDVDLLTLVALRDHTATQNGTLTVMDTLDLPGRVAVLSAAGDNLFVTMEPPAPEGSGTITHPTSSRESSWQPGPWNVDGAPGESQSQHQLSVPDVLVFDTSGPSYKLQQTLEAAGSAVVVGEHVYLFHDTTLRVVTADEPNAPEVASLTIPPFRRFVGLDHGRLYFEVGLDDEHRLVALDTRQPAAPQLIPGLDGLPAGLRAVADGCLYVLTADGWLEAIDVTDSLSPTLTARRRFQLNDTTRFRLEALSRMLALTDSRTGLHILGRPGSLGYFPRAGR